MKKVTYISISFLLGVIAAIAIFNRDLFSKFIAFLQSPWFDYLLILILVGSILIIVGLIRRHGEFKRTISAQEKEIYELHLQIGELQKSQKK